MLLPQKPEEIELKLHCNVMKLMVSPYEGHSNNVIVSILMQTWW